MPARFGQHEAVTGSGLATRLKAGQNPATAWDDPAGAAYPGPGGVSGQAPANEEPSAGNGGLRRDPRQGQVTFYDREALREQIKALQNEKRDLSNTEVDLGLRLAKAQATLSAMRTKKCALSEEKILSEATSFVPARDKVGRRSENLWGRKYRDKTGDGARNRHEARDLKRQEETNFAAQDRIMELELLNDQLRKGQGEAEKKTKSQQAASDATTADLQKAAQRLTAMPKRFTQNLPSLRDEVDRLEREKLSLELAKQQKTLKEADLLASAMRQQAYLREELTSLLDEIDDVEEDRDRWKRRLRVESTRVASLRSQRDETLGDLRQRFGGDAVERAAFAFFSGVHKDGAGRGGAEWGGRRADGEAPLDGDRVDEPASTSGSFGDHDDGECPKIPVSMIAKALRPAYGPDCDCGGDGDSTTLLTTEAVAEAVASACGADCSTMSEGERQGLRLTFEDFLVVAERLTRSKVEDHAARSD